MRIRTILLLLPCMSILAACGDDDDGGNAAAVQPATLNASVAKTNVTTTLQGLENVRTNPNDVSGAVSLLANAASQSQSAFTASAPTATRSYSGGLELATGIAPRTFGGPGCECQGGNCTFTNCSLDASGTSSSGSLSSKVTVNGALSFDVGTGHMVCTKLSYSFDTALQGTTGSFTSGGTFTEDCDVTITETTIKGFIHVTGSAAGSVASTASNGAYSSSFDDTWTYDVTWSPSATGTVHVKGSNTTSYGGYTQSYAGEGDVVLP